MKFQFHSFFSGVLVSALVLGTAVSALAISGRMTIEVDPINIQVNGQTFAPTDANGSPVPVFAYNGTTYAPVRALAQAYGLEVGYDPEKNMATVTDPDAKPATPNTTANVPDYDHWSAEDEAAYQEWKALWEPVMSSLHIDDNWERWYCFTDVLHDEIKDVAGEADTKGFVFRLATEISNGGTELELEFIPRDGIGTSYFKQISLPH